MNTISQQIQNMHIHICILKARYLVETGHDPTCLFVGPSYQELLKALGEEFLANIPADCVDLEKYEDMLIYPIMTDTLLVGHAIPTSAAQ